jgi:hypothetical protein
LAFWRETAAWVWLRVRCSANCRKPRCLSAQATERDRLRHRAAEPQPNLRMSRGRLPIGRRLTTCPTSARANLGKKRRNGTAVVLGITVNQQGGDVSGKWVAQIPGFDGNQTISEGKVSGDDISFVMVFAPPEGGGGPGGAADQMRRTGGRLRSVRRSL